MGELFGAVLFGWLWVSVARLLLWPFSPPTRRTWLLPVAVALVGLLFCAAAMVGTLGSVSPLSLAINVASLSFFLWRARTRHQREARDEAQAQEQGEREREQEDRAWKAKLRAEKAQTPQRKERPKATSKPASNAAESSTAPAPATSASAIDGTTDDGEAWRVDLEAMTLDFQGQAYRLRRTTEGAWQARRRGGEWLPLDDLDGHLATVTDTRWRRYVKA